MAVKSPPAGKLFSRHERRVDASFVTVAVVLCIMSRIKIGECESRVVVLLRWVDTAAVLICPKPDGIAKLARFMMTGWGYWGVVGLAVVMAESVPLVPVRP
jgi:hypothetical protein